MDMIRPNQPMRVFEAMYAKVLVSWDTVKIPQPEDLTMRTGEMLELIRKIYSGEPF